MTFAQHAKTERIDVRAGRQVKMLLQEAAQVSRKNVGEFLFDAFDCGRSLMGKIINTSHALVYRRVRAFGESLPEPVVSRGIRQMQFGEMRHFISSKKRKLRVIKTVKHCTRKFNVPKSYWSVS
jgi:hypothetical protein